MIIMIMIMIFSITITITITIFIIIIIIIIIMIMIFSITVAITIITVDIPTTSKTVIRSRTESGYTHSASEPSTRRRHLAQGTLYRTWQCGFEMGQFAHFISQCSWGR
jgi:hypothetical protein